MKLDVSRAQLGTAAGYAGTAIRYSFYVTGIFVFVVVGLIALAIWHWLPPGPGDVSSSASFTIADSQIARRPAVFKSINRSAGRLESLQYGQLYDRDTDMTVVLVAPSAGYQTLTRSYAREISELGLSGFQRSPSGVNFYDLETRFGSVRAAEFAINSDGHVKLCATFLSRFDSAAFYYKGWYCEANGARPNPTSLACILDKLKLIQPLPSAEANAFVQDRMARPARCVSEPVSQTTDVRGMRREPLPRLIR
jgi:hypothetical protein